MPTLVVDDDGFLPLPKGILDQLGWVAGDELILSQGFDGDLVVELYDGAQPEQDFNTSVNLD
jgi:bifunctional DNA-binding transcriptional regulator/antitoxin component of YhaV-PrlF toxin-antitoxin module